MAPLFPKYIGGDVNNPDSFVPEKRDFGAGQCSDEMYLKR